MIYTDLRTGLRKGALSALMEFPDAAIIFSHKDGNELPESYGVLNILNIVQQGHSKISTFANENRELTISSSYEVTVQFSFVGSLSGDMATSFTHRISSNPLVIESLMKYSLGYLRKSQIRRAPQKRDTKWVEYHNVDVTFSYIVNTQQVVDTVETVILQANDSPPFSVPPGYLNP